jgi:hypothetical protein
MHTTRPLPASSRAGRLGSRGGERCAPAPLIPQEPELPHLEARLKKSPTLGVFG